MQDEIKSGIYCIENKINHKKYIGQSVDINDRWRKHISELNHNTHDNSYLQNAWNKYGRDIFEFNVIEYCKISELDDRENYYINYYKTLNREFGYNLKSGGQNGGSKYSEETKLKMSKSAIKSYENLELIEKRKQDALEQWSNPEIKEKHMGKNNGMYGKHHTEETINKIKEKRKNVKKKKEIRQVFCIELNMTFKNASQAAKYLNISAANILNVCYGKRKTCGGYHFEFVENENNNG